MKIHLQIGYKINNNCNYNNNNVRMRSGTNVNLKKVL